MSDNLIWRVKAETELMDVVDACGTKSDSEARSLLRKAIRNLRTASLERLETDRTDEDALKSLTFQPTTVQRDEDVLLELLLSRNLGRTTRQLAAMIPDACIATLDVVRVLGNMGSTAPAPAAVLFLTGMVRRHKELAGGAPPRWLEEVVAAMVMAYASPTPARALLRRTKCRVISVHVKAYAMKMAEEPLHDPYGFWTAEDNAPLEALLRDCTHACVAASSDAPPTLDIVAMLDPTAWAFTAEAEIRYGGAEGRAELGLGDVSNAALYDMIRENRAM